MAVELYDEHEQSERVRKWIKEYAPSMIIAVVLAFAGIFGFRQWQDHQASQRVLAAEYFEVVRQELEVQGLEAAREQYQAMGEAVGRSAYYGLAGLHLASAHVDEGRLAPAERIYRDILDERRLRSIWPVATLRLVRVLEAQGEIEEALSLLEEPPPPGYRGAWAEARGDLHFQRGRLEQARVAWQEALDHQPEQGANTRLLQLKIDAAGSAAEEEAT